VAGSIGSFPVVESMVTGGLPINEPTSLLDARSAGANSTCRLSTPQANAARYPLETVYQTSRRASVLCAIGPT
jgi:hypothetical protein